MPDTPFSFIDPKKLQHGWPFPEKKRDWEEDTVVADEGPLELHGDSSTSQMDVSTSEQAEDTVSLWSSTPPTQPGFYWTNDASGYLSVAELTIEDDGHAYVFPIGTFTREPVEYVDLWGPRITPPGDDK